MIKNILSVFLIICTFILSCSSPSNPDNNNNNNNNGYIANGLNEKYNGDWSFYNADNTGNNPVKVTISGGSISGLIISNETVKQDFNKSKIYSKNDKFANIYYSGYYGYIVSDGDWLGEIQLPMDSPNGIGYVSIKNKSNNKMIVGILDRDSGIKRGENLSEVGDIKGTWNNDKKQLIIDSSFITYSDNRVQKLKIPFKFFNTFSGYGGTGYEIKGLLYDGVNINVTEVSGKGKIKFRYTENFHNLQIERGADGVPTKAEYIQKTENIVPVSEFTKS